MNESIIAKFEHVSKLYGKTAALKEASAEFALGQVTVLLGHNGSGKTTMLRLLASLAQADTGNVSVLNGLNKSNPNEFKKHIGMLFDHNAHFDTLTGYQNAWFFLRAYKTSKKDTADRLKELFRWIGLYDKKDEPVSSYSYGMRRKLALLEAVAHKPKLLLLDEPSMGLDYATRLEFYQLVGDLCQQGVSVIISTNDIYEATFLAQQIIFLRSGNIVVKGEPKALLAQLKQNTKIEITMTSPLPQSIFDSIEGVEKTEIFMDKDQYVLRLLVESNKTIISQIINQIFLCHGNITNLQIQEPHLGDVYLKYQ